MNEYQVIESTHQFVTMNHSMVALLISMIVGLAIIKFMESPGLIRYRIGTLMLVVASINVAGYYLDYRERIAGDTPRCKSTLQAANGEKLELNYKTPKNQTCFVVGSKVLKMDLPGKELPKGTLYMEQGVSGPHVFIQ